MTLKKTIFIVLFFMLLVEAKGSYDCVVENHQLKRTSFGLVCDKGNFKNEEN